MLNLIKLENRIVLDGAAVGEALEHAFAHESAIVEKASFVTDHNGHNDDAEHVSAVAALLGADDLGGEEMQAEPLEVILIADSLPDYQKLAGAAESGAQVIVYNAADESAEEVIARVAQAARESGRPLDSLTLLSHGGEGNFRLGNEEITAGNVDENADAWAELGSVMSDDGQIYLFGCNVGSGQGGELLNRLADATGAGVFASDDATGEGGDWMLETGSEGADQAQPPLDTEKLADYAGQLVAPTIEGTPPPTVSQGGLYNFTPSASDIEGDIIGFSISNQPEWAEFDAATGRLYGTPENADVGEYSEIVIGVTDAEGDTTTLPPFSITVLNINDAPEISGKPIDGVQEGQAYSFTPTAQDMDMIPGIDPEESLTFAIANLPSWASFDTATGRLYGTPAKTDIGVYRDISITVTDRDGATASLRSFDITVEELNTPPTISGTPPTTVNQDGEYVFTPTASDAEDDDASLRFSISKQPSWASFDPNTGELGGTPGNDDVGIYDNIKITVTDSQGLNTSLPEFDIRVVNVNDEPTISGTSMNDIQEGTYYSFIPTSDDKDLRVDPNENLTFGIVNKPSWASFDTNTGELNGTPQTDDVGVYRDISITVTDAGGIEAPLVFNLNVVNLNDAPIISGTPPIQVEQDSSYYFKPTASDREDDAEDLKFSISKQPEWAEFNPDTGELSGTPDNGHVGMYTGIIITVTDTTGLSASLSEFGIEVVNVNDRPTISGVSVNEIQEDTYYSFIPTSGDKDLLVDPNEELTFTIVGKPVWADFDADTGELSGTPVREDVGDYNNIVITVTDEGGLDKSLNFNLTVVKVNDAPVIEGTPPTQVLEDDDYYFRPSASDLDNDPLEFSISNQPAWATFNTQTGELSGTPVNANVGLSEGIVITVTDTTGLSSSLSEFSIEVVNVNDAPTITGTSTQSVQEGTEYSFIPTSNDIDLLVDSTERLTYSIESQPAWANFNVNTGELHGTPGANDVGTYPGIVITVTDEGGLTASLPFSLTVTSSNLPPVIQGAPPTQVLEDSEYRFTPIASDDHDVVISGARQGGVLEFSISNQPAWADFNKATGELTGTPVNEDVGVYNNIVITVTDSGGLSSSLPEFSIEVINVNDEPEIVSEPVKRVRLNTDYNFEPTRSDVDMNPGYNVPVVDPNESLTYEIENMPRWAAFYPATGALSGVPTDKRTIEEGGDVGIWENVTITVTDNYGEQNQLVFPIDVIYVNAPPVVQPDEFTIPEGTPGDRPVGPVRANDPDGEIVIYQIIGGNDAGIFQIDPETGAITTATEVPDWERTPFYDLDVQVRDNDGDSAQATIRVNVLNVKPTVDLDGDNDGNNDLPVDRPNVNPDLDYAVQFVEDCGPVYLADVDDVDLDGNAIITDPQDPDAILTSLTVTLTNPYEGDVLALDGNGISGTNIVVSAYDPGTGILLLSGEDTTVNYTTVLRRITFENTSGNPVGDLRQIVFEATDTDGNQSNPATSWVTVIPLNDAPVNGLPGDQFTPPDTPIVFSADNGNALTTSDVDAYNPITGVPAMVIVTLTVEQGSLTVSNGPAVVNQIAANQVGLSGTIEQINASLNGLVYTPQPGWIGEDALTMTTDDLGNTGYGIGTYNCDSKEGDFDSPPFSQIDTDVLRITVGKGAPHVGPERPPGPADVDDGGAWKPDAIDMDIGDVGFLDMPGNVKDAGDTVSDILRRMETLRSRDASYRSVRGDDELYRCCTLEEAIRVGCRLAPALDPEARLSNVTWKWLEEELGWPPPLLDEEFDLYKSNPDQRHFLRDEGDPGLGGVPGELAWAFFGGPEGENAYNQFFHDEGRLVQGSDEGFNAQAGDIKHHFYSGREDGDRPATWNSDAWPLLGNPTDCVDGTELLPVPSSGPVSPGPSYPAEPGPPPSPADVSGAADMLGESDNLESWGRSASPGVDGGEIPAENRVGGWEDAGTERTTVLDENPNRSFGANTAPSSPDEYTPLDTLIMDASK